MCCDLQIKDYISNYFEKQKLTKKQHSWIFRISAYSFLRFAVLAHVVLTPHTGHSLITECHLKVEHCHLVMC